MRDTTALPIDEIIPSLRAAMAARVVAVLEAPPGAGKTTRVPLALMHEPWLAGTKVVMLEPRRLAARAAASYMASILGEEVGQTVGYRVRGESRISKRTRIEVVTEGVLARMLSSDAALEDIGLVIFDEFHERSLHADLGLALVLEAQRHLRDELRVLVMSATLDGVAVSALLADDGGPAPVLRSEGRMFPIETHYRAPRRDERIEATTARVIREALDATEDDVLVFLPGAGEQRRVAERLTGDTMSGVRVHTLHGGMPLAEQDAALAPARVGTRKVVLSTSVAETSLTVAGVRVVIDCGLSRVPRYDASAGLTRLHTVRVSRASADQRRGRAGRTAPGVSYRLWDQHEDHTLLPSTRPEIVDADLSSLALELADAGISDPTTLRWLDVPRAGPFSQARGLLAQLGALDDTGRITPHGRRMAALPLQPRLAHLAIVAAERGALPLGAAIAALLEERDIVRYDGLPPQSDMRLRTELLRRDGAASAAGVAVDRDGVRRVRQTADDLARRTAGGGSNVVRSSGSWDDADTGSLLALAYPDRVAQRRSGAEPRYLLRNGSGAVLAKHDALYDAPYLAIADLEGTSPEARIVRAAPITLEELREDFGDQFERVQLVEWDERTKTVRARKRTMLGAMVIDEVVWSDAEPSALLQAVLDAIRAQLARSGVEALPLSQAASRLRERMAFVRAHDESWPDVSVAALSASLEDWAGPYLDGVRTWAQLASVDWHEALQSLMPWPQRSALERLAPTHIDVPSGSRIALDYSDPMAPVLAVKLQEVFGWSTTPMVMDGRVSLTLQLLSPAQRPVQVTRDLAGFWRSSYFEVRKELRGRYPRHPWPEDPLTAEATRRAKPRGT
ncbi:ATP-dependent helicase HrpB [Gemmatimonas groenlandica]|nr:ATP-dependent helicase HrpB [Gemmatimonas groenlandica]